MNAKNIVAASFLIAALSIAYYFVIFIPGKENSKRELEIHKYLIESANTEEKKKQLQQCLDDAQFAFDDYWNKVCKEQGLKDDCSLPKYNADTAKGYLQDWKNDCFKKYPQN